MTSSKVAKLRISIDDRQQLSFLDPVDLVQQEKSFSFSAGFNSSSVNSSPRPKATDSIHDQQHDDRLRSWSHARISSSVRSCDESACGCLACREHDLAFRTVTMPRTDVTGRLRFVGDDGNFLADEAVQERGLSGIRPADDRNKSGFHVMLSSFRNESLQPQSHGRAVGPRRALRFPFRRARSFRQDAGSRPNSSTTAPATVVHSVSATSGMPSFSSSDASSRLPGTMYTPLLSSMTLSPSLSDSS